MDEQEVQEHRYRFFAEKGAQLAFDQDKILVTLLTGIIAGLLALLVSQKFGFWTAVAFLIADLSAVVGLGACLLHMGFSSKVMSLLAAKFGGEANVPNLVAREEPTDHALRKNLLFAQMCYASQLGCLFWSVLFAALGVVTMLWPVVGWCGLLLAFVFVVGLVIAVLRPLVAVYRLARIALEHQSQQQGIANDD